MMSLDEKDVIKHHDRVDDNTKRMITMCDENGKKITYPLIMIAHDYC